MAGKFKGEPDNAKPDISQETKAAAFFLPPAFKENLEKLLTSNPYPLYAVLLGRDSDKFLKDYVAKNWINLHYMSGEDCLFFSAYAPEKIDTEVVDYWKKKLKDEFKEIWDNTPNAAWSYEYARMLNVPYDKFPCLFLGTDLKSNTGFVLKIPKWNEDDLTRLFELLFQKAHESAKLSPSERFELVEREVDSFYNVRLGIMYIKAHWMEYVKPKDILEDILKTIIAATIAGIKKGAGLI
jgi:hypothetical protein